MIEDFFHLPPVSKTLEVNLELRIYLPEKLETALIAYSGAWGELIHEKNRSQKSRDTVPLMIVDPSEIFFLFQDGRTSAWTALAWLLTI
jgi:hypothetical protein